MVFLTVQMIGPLCLVSSLGLFFFYIFLLVSKYNINKDTVLQDRGMGIRKVNKGKEDGRKIIKQKHRVVLGVSSSE